ncbi:hypothetical protein HY643_01715 [Candidatus Woesearchaeota archaeon]|nr:hypothetical protein [Candidatus Woesearchaeota archaeon]
MEPRHYTYTFPFMLDFERMEKEVKESLEEPIAGVDFFWLLPNSFRCGWKDTEALRKRYVSWIKEYCKSTQKELPSNLESRTTTQLRGVYKGILCSALHKRWYYQGLFKEIKYQTGIAPPCDIHKEPLETLVLEYEKLKEKWKRG